ncbi:B3 domain-containing protein REM5 [Prunus persica]|uniref:B3 domain-containing protein REM5 n=1 Tax=Prunus persica TaxID=3760 RepID=UPI0009AB2F6B|nr:B3 domain-containing protein REM5 [Prunus persica]
MARKPTKPCPKLPSFFKVLLGDDFPRQLCLPPAFMVHYNGPSHCKCALRGPTGKWWTVGLEEREDGFYFREGWRRFLTDHSLKVGYFLVFDHQGGPKFDVTIYHPMGCDMRRSIGNSDKPGKRPATAAAVEETSTGSIVFRSEHPCFIRILGKNQYRMNIPKELAVAEGLIGKEKVMLKDPNGRSWNVKLRLDNKEHHGGRLLMTQGLVACWQANNISLGDTIVFELVKRSEMESIPPEFMNYVNGRLPPTCTLRGPSGECWTVGLELRGD